MPTKNKLLSILSDAEQEGVRLENGKYPTLSLFLYRVPGLS